MIGKCMFKVRGTRSICMHHNICATDENEKLRRFFISINHKQFLK